MHSSRAGVLGDVGESWLPLDPGREAIDDGIVEVRRSARTQTLALQDVGRPIALGPGVLGASTFDDHVREAARWPLREHAKFQPKFATTQSDHETHGGAERFKGDVG